jgi:hypothetical protein
MEASDVNKWRFEQRLAALKDDVKYWRRLTETNNDFRRHSRQVAAFSKILEQLWALVDPGKTPVGDGADARERSRVILGLFRIWQFLRGKLVQRTDPSFRQFLWLADEYAWLCYKPLYDYGLKEPPLVFLNGGYSPFTLTREEGFEGEYVPHELLQSQTLLDAMASLPFPVIGVPWYQLHDFAELPVIGHEVGHSVEADLKLDGLIRQAISGAVQEGPRQAKWSSWSSELFADVYGCMGCGPAFVSALASFLSVERMDAGRSEYPPPALRFHFNLDILRIIYGDAVVPALAAKWKNTYILDGEWIAFLDDTRKIAEAILDLPLANNGKVRSLIPFEQDSRFVSELVAKVISRNSLPSGMPLRALLAAYRLAFDRLMDDTGVNKIGAELAKLKPLQLAMMNALKPDTRSGEITRTAEQRRTQGQNLNQSAAVWMTQLKS